MKAIQELLRQKMGLHAATIGASAVDRAVRARMDEHRLTRQEDYLRLVQQSPLEWNALVESVVVTETWFFRDPQSVNALTHLVLTEWLPTHPAGQLRLLSVPCATGEEPYSLAMALLDAGIAPGRFQIDAVDISGRALIAAQQGRYRRNSFRGPDLGFRDRHFAVTDQGYALNPDVKRQVRLQQGNLLAENCLRQAGSYDFVFCRNLLIYFDVPTQAAVMQKLWRLLAPGGMLFLGPAELPLALGRGFVPVNFPLSFACRKINEVHPVAAVPPKRIHRGRPAATRTPLFSAPALSAMAARADRQTAATPANEADLSRAQQLADAGRFAEAAEICEAHLRAQGASAEAYYLLGSVRNAAGADTQAGEFYRRALYLKPDHYQTMRQWAALSAKQGNEAQARILHTRAERARRPEIRG